MEQPWQIRLLGRLNAERGARILSNFRRQKTGFLLAYLAHFARRAHPRDALIERFWPDADHAAGRISLSVALSFLRQNLEPPGVAPGAVLIVDRISVRLDPAAVVTDVAAFEAAVRDAARADSPEAQLRHLTDADERYRGEFLAGCYDEWALLERERLAEAHLQAQAQLICLLESLGDAPSALDHARRAVAADPLREESHQELIRLLMATGQPQAARRHFAELERLLKSELDAAPAPETGALLTLPPSAISHQPSAVSPSRPLVLSFPRSLVPSFPHSLAPSPPTGTVTFLIASGDLDPAHFHHLVRGHGGYALQSPEPSAHPVAFQSAGDALACAIALQRAPDGALGARSAQLAVPASTTPSSELRAPSASEASPRVALHTGDARYQEGEYHAPALHLSRQLLAVGHEGQILCSETTATLLRRDPEPGTRLDDLGVYLLPDRPDPERLFQAALAGTPPGDFPPLRAEARHSGHLPPSLTRFFGREREIARLCELLLPPPQARLVTLLGPGGSGKTRLALELARQLVPEWRGAIWFVPLADVTEPARIPDAIRQALQLPPSATQEPIDQVASFLAERPSLLLLDNLEHLQPHATPPLRRLLERVPELSLLVTSRSRLRLSGERVFTVPPLPTDGPSIHLFVDRAQATSPDFALTDANAADVAALCRRLEGLPLAIELAAARAGVLTPRQILAQLDRGLGVLAGRDEDAPPRHRSLRAAVDWSYRLLDPPLQRFFAALAVFQGGWSLEAAEAVCGEVMSDEGRVMSGGDDSVLDMLEQMRECSLVFVDEVAIASANASRITHDSSLRFRMLEPLREYAREQLDAPTRAELERRHAAHFLALAERAREEIADGREQATWLDRCDIDHDNLRAALNWSLQNSERAEIALRLAAAIALFWERRGYYAEGRERLAAVLDATDPTRSGADVALPLGSLRAATYTNAGALAWRQGDYEDARAFLEASLALCRSLEDRPATGNALSRLGAVAFSQGDFAASRDYGLQSLAIYRELGSRRSVAVELYNLGNVAFGRGDCDAARPLFEESHAVFLELGDRYAVAHASNGLGNVCHIQGDWARARTHYEEGLALRRELGDRAGISEALHSLGFLERDQGDYAAAQASLEESLALRRELDAKRGIAGSLHGLGTVAFRQGDLDAARPLLEESASIYRAQGDRHNLAAPLADLGSLLARHGDPIAARQLLNESLAILQETGDQNEGGVVLGELGSLAADEGEVDVAAQYFADSLAATRHVSHRLGSAAALDGLARVAAARAEPRVAVQLHAAAAALRESLGAPLYPIDRPAHEARIATLRTILGDAAFDAAWDEGSALHETATDKETGTDKETRRGSRALAAERTAAGAGPREGDKETRSRKLGARS